MSVVVVELTAASGQVNRALLLPLSPELSSTSHSHPPSSPTRKINLSSASNHSPAIVFEEEDQSDDLKSGNKFSPVVLHTFSPVVLYTFSPVVLYTYSPVFGSEEFLRAAVDAGEVVWNRGLLKRVGLCHGISGNTYVFFSLYRLTGKVEFLYRAKAFACFLNDRAQVLISEGIMHGGDRPYSLFEGLGGMAYLFLDMIEPSEARFPCYEL
ncbi:unnamed protein product [Ilex paraguariensis]|uniref:Uncharacterized protein n=1 Tax=Ilex paraguariensis TaxID=185542 RepID=A0ABC8UY27_9AQUA